MAPDTARLPVMLVEADILAFADEPAEHIARARLALAAHELTRAATQLRTAAAFVRVQSSAASGQNKAALVQAGEDLDRAATDVRLGAVGEAAALDRAVRRTDLALARHHLSRASRAWARRDSTNAGRELGAAASYAERLVHDGNETTLRALDDAARQSEKVSGALIEGTAQTDRAVSASLNDLARELREPDQRGG